MQEGVPLRAGTFRYGCLEAHTIAQESSLGNHDAVVDAKAIPQ